MIYNFIMWLDARQEQIETVSDVFLWVVVVVLAVYIMWDYWKTIINKESK